MKIKDIRQPRKTCTNSKRRKELPHYCAGITTGTVKEMVTWAGATWETRKQCRKMIKAGKQEFAERKRLVKIPGTKEHQVLVDNLRLMGKGLSAKKRYDALHASKYKKYLTKDEIQFILA